MSRISLGTSCIDQVDPPEFASEISKRIAARTPSQIVTLNALMYNETLKDEELARAIRQAAMVIADSAGIAWAVKFLHGKGVRRLAGIDLIDTICEISSREGYRIALLGAKPGVAREAGEKLSSRHPGLIISGTFHGYFSHDEEPALFDKIRALKPDIILAGLAVPHQEKWISRHLEEFGASIVMGVGGSFDVLSGRLKRAPVFMQRAGLEWLFRLIQQPWRISRIKDLPFFVLNMIKLKLGI